MFEIFFMYCIFIFKVSLYDIIACSVKKSQTKLSESSQIHQRESFISIMHQATSHLKGRMEHIVLTKYSRHDNCPQPTWIF